MSFYFDIFELDKIIFYLIISILTVLIFVVVVLSGIEPESEASETSVLSIVLQDRFSVVQI